VTALTITLNGELREVTGPLTLSGLLAQLELSPETVVVEHNRRIVRRGELASHPVSTGDVVEIVHFVGGG
jgi:thiamine biosynthesis protein ThiS